MSKPMRRIHYSASRAIERAPMLEAEEIARRGNTANTRRRIGQGRRMYVTCIMSKLFASDAVHENEDGSVHPVYSVCYPTRRLDLLLVGYTHTEHVSIIPAC